MRARRCGRLRPARLSPRPAGPTHRRLRRPDRRHLQHLRGDAGHPQRQGLRAHRNHGPRSVEGNLIQGGGRQSRTTEFVRSMVAAKWPGDARNKPQAWPNMQVQDRACMSKSLTSGACERLMMRRSGVGSSAGDGSPHQLHRTSTGSGRTAGRQYLAVRFNACEGQLRAECTRTSAPAGVLRRTTGTRSDSARCVSSRSMAELSAGGRK